MEGSIINIRFTIRILFLFCGMARNLHVYKDRKLKNFYILYKRQVEHTFSEIVLYWVLLITNSDIFFEYVIVMAS